MDSPKTHYELGRSWGDYREIDIKVEVINQLHSDDMDENEFELEIRLFGPGYYERETFYSVGESTTVHIEGSIDNDSKINAVSINLHKREGLYRSIIQKKYITSEIEAFEGGNIYHEGVKPNLSSGYLIMILIIIIIEFIVLTLPQYMVKGAIKK